MAELERIEKEKKAAEAKRLAEEEAARKAIEEKAKHMAELERIEKEKKAAEAKRLAEEEAARKATEEKLNTWKCYKEIKSKVQLQKESPISVNAYYAAATTTTTIFSRQATKFVRKRR